MQEEHDDIELDPETGIDDSVLGEEHQADTIKKLKEKLKQAESKAKENLDNWQRAQADFVNLRKRDDEAKVEFLKFAKAGIMEDIIPVLDSFTQALAHGQKEAEPIYSQLMQILKRNGLEELNPLGEQFDPSKHESVGVIETDKEDEDHKIMEVFQKGYALEGKIIRPAKVRIGEYKG
jgi:molecular chaperone GrpE